MSVEKVSNHYCPIIYSPKYNISFYGFERFHSFDSKKWGNVYKQLKDAGIFEAVHITEPEEISEEELLLVHTKEYLNSLKWSYNVARIIEIPFICCIPNFILQKKILKPFRYHVGGTVLASRLALEKNWAVNLGGGFHHCSSKQGGGFCVYADITLCIKLLFDHVPTIKKIIIIDLDAHQGNGYEQDFYGDDRVYIMDVYNAHIYPDDQKAKLSIKRNVMLDYYTKDDEYLQKLEINLQGAFNEYKYDFVLYNAGTDILDGDLLGRLKISEEGIITRDEMVFRAARKHNTPIVMLTSGGYHRKSANVIANSILNLLRKSLIYF